MVLSAEYKLIILLASLVLLMILAMAMTLEVSAKSRTSWVGHTSVAPDDNPNEETAKEDNVLIGYTETGNVHVFMTIARQYPRAWTDQFVHGTIRIDLKKLPPHLADEVMKLVELRGHRKVKSHYTAMSADRSARPQPIKDTNQMHNDHPLTITFDGSQGCGKTTALNMFVISLLENGWFIEKIDDNANQITTYMPIYRPNPEAP